MRLRELLEVEQFKLSVVTPGKDVTAADHPVMGAHISEMVGPAQFMAPGWILLTLGISLRGDSRAQRRLVAELEQAGMSGLGFGLGVAFKRVPAGILEEAEKRDFQVFSVPYETPFRDIVSYVNRALLSTTVSELQRSASMQAYLLDALGHDSPAGEIVRRLAGLLESKVILFDSAGEVLAFAGGKLPEGLWEEMDRNDNAVTTTSVGRSELTTIVIGDTSISRRWLAVISPRPIMSRSMVHSVVRSAETILRAIHLGNEAAATERRAVRSKLLEDAITADPSRSVEVGARLTNYGFDFSIPGRVFVLRDGTEMRHEAHRAALRNEVEHYADQVTANVLTAIHKDAIVGLAQPGSAVIDELITYLESVHERDIFAGVGREVASVARIADSYRDAETLVAECRPESMQVRRFEQVRLANRLINVSHTSDVRAGATALLGALKDSPELLDTLAAFLESGLRASATASALNIHENSLRYRLARIEALTGRSLRETANVVDFHLALLIGID